ncbi:hypothetical protein HPC49_01395 [Pyxidicoccus fallax]|uniref:Lipoprotein n=1 Tax=Pyxidicoccus fallax TaxID=394095 RepID=A0A848L8R2_9BACT|nr:hypothetical protein [Pyxidicoccus fallax]NMO15209.1 hypothetical protein [Pyxidicoccus fallax]NPC76908.1 hypothetical protein [Pyxidicoccus fallax]
MAFSAVLLLASLLACGSPPAPQPPHTDSVNLVLGDASFQARFGRSPTARDSEDLRIRVHLEHVLELLRQRPTAHRSPAAREARARNLERLAAYIRAGVFPRNDGHPDARRPTFIDSRGRICAVGYLLEQDLGRGAAEAISAVHKYAFIREIDSPRLTRWAATSGLDREELEMIQPSYPREDYEKQYGPVFSLLEPLDGRGHVSVAPGMLFDGRGDGVPVRLDLSMAFICGCGLGPYASVSLTKLTGAARAASALSNLDVGVVWAEDFFSSTWLMLRGGLLLATGDEDEVGMSLNSAVAAMRPTQAVLFQPGAMGVRTGASVLMMEFFCEDCSLRLDAGLDGYTPFSSSFQLSPRWGAGFAYRVSPYVATLEVGGARYAETLASKSEFHHSVGGSFRLAPDERMSAQPGVSVSVPLEDRLQRWFLGFDVTLRH